MSRGLGDVYKRQDKTLIDMAAKVPVSKSEMLNVSGVGENKFSKYGESFLSVVEKCAGEYPELLINKVDAAKEKEKPTLSKASKKLDFPVPYVPIMVKLCMPERKSFTML